MTTRELLYVKTVADAKNISRAARKLFVAQPSLSQSLQRIEDNVGTKLFVRSPNGLKLTYAGEKYYQMACQVLKIFDDFEAEVADLNDLKAGHIYFGITNHLGSFLLPKVLPVFQKECPNIDIDIYEGSTDDQETNLLSGDLDFSVMHAPVADAQPNPSLNYEILANHPFIIAVSSNSPLIRKAVVTEGYEHPVLDLKYLQNEPLLTLHKGQRIRHVTDFALRQAHITPEIRLTSRNYDTLLRLAASGYGYTMVPSDYVGKRHFDESPYYLSIDRKYGAYWSLCIATLKDSFQSKADQHMIELLRKNFKEA